jgi:hypothetical protein
VQEQQQQQQQNRRIIEAETLWETYGRISRPNQVVASQEALAIIVELKMIKALQESLKEKDKELRTHLLYIMREADTLIDTNGQVLATWRAIAPRKTVDVAYLQRTYPNIYAEVVREGEPYRRLVFK